MSDGSVAASVPDDRESPENPPAPIVGSLVRQPHGGALKRGGANPGAGRPTTAFKQVMRELATMPEVFETLSQILRGEQAIQLPNGVMLVDGRLWLDAYKYVCDRGFGKPVTEAEHKTAEAMRRPLVIRFVDGVKPG